MTRQVDEVTVALIGPEVEENLSLRYLAAALGERGFSSGIVPFGAPQDLAVGLRERGHRGHITSGGHFAAFAWGELLRDFPELDTICLHEAEETLPELVAALLEDRPTVEIPGLAWRGWR